MTPHGFFWVRLSRQSNEGVLSVISQSIKYVDLLLALDDQLLTNYLYLHFFRVDVDHCIAQRIISPKIGQYCSAYFEWDKTWHRVQVISIISAVCVSSVIINL